MTQSVKFTFLVFMCVISACRDREKHDEGRNESEVHSIGGFFGTWEKPCLKVGSYDSYSVIKLILRHENNQDRYRMTTEVYSDSGCSKPDLFRHELGTFRSEASSNAREFALTMKVDKVFAVPHTVDRVNSFKTDDTCKTKNITLGTPVLCMESDAPRGTEYELLLGGKPTEFIEWAGAKGQPRPKSLKSSSAVRMNAAKSENIDF